MSFELIEKEDKDIFFFSFVGLCESSCLHSPQFVVSYYVLFDATETEFDIFDGLII